MRIGLVGVGLLVMAYACGGENGATQDAPGASGADGGDAQAGGGSAHGGNKAQGGTQAMSGGHPSGGNSGNTGGNAAAGELSNEPQGGMPNQPQGGTAGTAQGGAPGEPQGGMPSEPQAGMPGEPRAGAPAAGEGGAGGAPVITIVDNPIVLAETKFLDYGSLRIGFTLPVDAATLQVTLAPVVPSKLKVAEIKQVDATTVDALLLDYHLPRDYQLNVSGKLDDGSPFQSMITLPGLGNGARVAFLTKQSGAGDLKNWPGAPADAATPRDAADAMCQAEADAAGLRGAFVAFLSQQGSYDAGCRAFGLDGLLANKCGQQAAPVDDAPWLGTTGLPIVDGATNVVSGFFQNAFEFYADGTRGQQVGIWTGTLLGAKAQTGTPGPTSADCVGWTMKVNFAEVTEFVGEYLLKYGEFGSGCGAGHRLLCLQVGAQFFGPSTLHETLGKRAFVSKGKLTGAMSFDNKTGVDAADALCQSEASGASYADASSFHAYLSTTQSDAVCHILGQAGKVSGKCGLSALPDAEPWRRADNYPIGTAAQLAKSSLTAPLSLAADGSAAFDQRPFTGTSSNGAAYTTCMDWSTADAGTTGVAGQTRALTNGWSFFTDSNCNFSQPVYCFEQ
jgi:hypothetical protein